MGGGIAFKKVKSLDPMEKLVNDTQQKNQYEKMVGAFQIKEINKEESEDDEDEDKDPDYSFTSLVDLLEIKKLI